MTWTNEALRWLEDIFEYIAAGNPDSASRTVEGIFERARVLSTGDEAMANVRKRLAQTPKRPKD